MTEQEGLYTFTLKSHHRSEDADDNNEWQDYDSLNHRFVEHDDNNQKNPSRKKRRLRHRTRDLKGGGGDDAYFPGIQYIDMFVGNPAQRLTFAISTNSDHTIFPCTSVRTTCYTLTKQLDHLFLSDWL